MNITPRKSPISWVAAADIFQRPNYGGRCLGVLVVCESGVKRIREGGLYPDDICEYDSIGEIRAQDSKLLEYRGD